MLLLFLPCLPLPTQVFLVINPTCIGYSLKVQSALTTILPTHIHTFIQVFSTQSPRVLPHPQLFFFFFFQMQILLVFGKIWKHFLQLSVQKLQLPAQESNYCFQNSERTSYFAKD